MRFVLAMLLMFSGYTFANCSNITDSDQRNYCNAKQSGSSCSYISNSDLRAACNAEVGGSSCSYISDSNLRTQCDSMKR
ncbi:hypothetical protein M2399_002832 [Pseudomonas sp. BIGb0450]|jgi:hypothetical protein|uniref:Lipoprotein n=1 Tax=Pseudomonas yamanorum TaxID=515393 RepID=A0A7Y8JSM0_9PSED|nr:MULTISPECIES: hypothetical protein [Pseudomonas]MCS3417430.1 hypothetical protein [Pseudomonas sp. BIGb0558]MCS3437391.1 hypothetical protein [Pseudomonas sp. BIGb0450]NVZ85883.1 hypothetical protein [Pseudomonas yamanorum]NWD26031.1 hypothetical protein [Pseudomonas yamanorum]NWE16969.1 hypothetical protein [Pseudomonas yamanorum]